MKLTDFRIRHLKIPFRTRFDHHLASRKRSSSVILELMATDGTRGYGEATPRPYVTGETIESTLSALEKISPTMAGIDLPIEAPPLKWIETWNREHHKELERAPSAACALELALLDLIGKLQQRPVISLFPPPQTQTIYYSTALSEGDMNQARALLSQMRDAGISTLKIKAGDDTQGALRNIDLARSIIGDAVTLRIDANGAWDMKSAVTNIQRFFDRGVQVFEQPLPASARADYPVLIQQIDSRILVMIDESLCTYEDAQWFIQNRGANSFNLKICKHGGLLETLRIHHLAKENGITCQLGCHVGETSLLTAAGLIFAALVGSLEVCEGALGTHLLAQDIVTHPLQFGPGGRLGVDTISTRPGLGVCVDRTLLNLACSGPLITPLR